MTALQRATDAVRDEMDRQEDAGTYQPELVARAALMAIREPDDSMVGCDSSAWFYAGSGAKDVWESCIETILDEAQS